eukprot:GEZU01010439.1.p1 GENE.GEZU01010439.1~~GEZU01010439.1.p1  ORF type:complete len:638 (-),score=170.37 GEZU01010439.1:52-1965(-)
MFKNSYISLATSILSCSKSAILGCRNTKQIRPHLQRSVLTARAAIRIALVPHQQQKRSIHNNASNYFILQQQQWHCMCFDAKTAAPSFWNVKSQSRSATTRFNVQRLFHSSATLNEATASSVETPQSTEQLVYANQLAVEGRECELRGSLSEAEKKHVQCLSILESLQTASNDAQLTQHIRECMNNLGKVQRKLGKLKESEELLARALQIAYRSKSEDDANAITTRLALARVYTDLSRFDDADSLLTSSLELLLKHKKKSKKKSAKNMHIDEDISYVYHIKGLLRVKQAQQYPPTLEPQYVPGQQSERPTPSPRNKLFTEAVKFFLKSGAILEDLIKSTNKTTTDNSNTHNSNNDENDFYKQFLSMHLGYNHKELAKCFMELNRVPEADTNFKQALSLLTLPGGRCKANPFDVIDTLGYMCTISFKNTALDKAEEYCKRAISMLEDPSVTSLTDLRGIDPQSSLATYLEFLAQLYAGSNRLRPSDTYKETLGRALAIKEKKLGSDSVQFGLTLIRAGFYTAEARMLREAEQFFKRALDIFHRKGVSTFTAQERSAVTMGLEAYAGFLSDKPDSPEIKAEADKVMSLLSAMNAQAHAYAASAGANSGPSGSSVGATAVLQDQQLATIATAAAAAEGKE